jgi:hypothetical protein
MKMEWNRTMVKINGDIGSVMMVYTGESPAQIIKSGVVTTALPFKLIRAENVKYVVCCQNAMIDGATELHNSAFLIGIVRDCNAADRDGILMGVSLNISHYVLVSKPNQWYAKRNPSHFFFPSLAAARIRLGRYDFTPLVKQSTVPMRATPAYAMAAKSRKGLVKRAKFDAAQTMPEAASEPVSVTERKAFQGSDLRRLIADALNVDTSKVSGTIKVRDASVTITIEF